MNRYQAFTATLVAICMSLAMLASEVSAQVCERLSEDDGGEHYILIDEEVHFFTTLERSRAINKRLQLLPVLEEEIKLLSTQVDVCRQSSSKRGELIVRLEEEIVYQQEFIDRFMSGHAVEPRWIDSPQLNFAAGVVIGALVVGGIVYFK